MLLTCEEKIERDIKKCWLLEVMLVAVSVQALIAVLCLENFRSNLAALLFFLFVGDLFVMMSAFF